MGEGELRIPGETSRGQLGVRITEEWFGLGNSPLTCKEGVLSKFMVSWPRTTAAETEPSGPMEG